MTLIKTMSWVIVAGIALSAGVHVANKKQKNNEPTQTTTATIDQLVFKTTSGEIFNSQNLKGKTVVLNFWASWCPPCVEEMPELEASYKELRSKNVEFVGVGIDTPENITNFLKNKNFSYPLLVAGAHGATLSQQLGNDTTALPFTVILNANGETLLKKLGRITPEEIKQVTLKTKNDTQG